MSVDTTELRELAAEALAQWGSAVPTPTLRAFHTATAPRQVIALLDELEATKAELDHVRGISLNLDLVRTWRDRAVVAEGKITRALEVRRTSNLTSAEMVYRMFRILTEGAPE